MYSSAWMSQISSNWPATPSRLATASACLREPLVKMNLRPGRASIAAAQSGKGGAVLVVIGLAQSLRVFERDAEAVGDELAHAPVDLGEQIAIGRVERGVGGEHPRPAMGE